MVSIHNDIILYERAQAEYDQFIAELKKLERHQLLSRIHELRLKTMVLELIVEERYTGEELEYLINQEEPLEILYNVLDRYIGF